MIPVVKEEEISRKGHSFVKKLRQAQRKGRKGSERWKD
jgi:hypothetical protein